ncbi:MAG: GNAT family N-acetyltransferase, partial [bacterium]|nr:GNAT family N-acetyltransferase [bacterium]
KKFEILQIDEYLANKIKEEKFINITDDYKNYGIGFCCIYNNEIIGVASSNIFYKDGIEVNIKVKEEYRRKGIATAMASKLIIECLSRNKKISWDASNTNSVRLAQKLGFEYDSEYDIYKFPAENNNQ